MQTNKIILNDIYFLIVQTGGKFIKKIITYLNRSKCKIKVILSGFVSILILVFGTPQVLTPKYHIGGSGIF